MLGVHIPIYLVSVSAPRKAEWKGLLALAILVVHSVAVGIALRVS